MRVALVYPEVRGWDPYYPGSYSEGLASIGATLRAQGAHVELVHLTSEAQLGAGEHLERLGAFEPDLVGISAMTPTFPYARQVARDVRRELGRPTVLGGWHALCAYRQALGCGDFDFVAVGEGEVLLPRLLDSLGSGGRLTPPAGVLRNIDDLPLASAGLHVEDLGTLPAPDRSLFDFGSLKESREHLAQLTAGRGCPCRCSYCGNATRQRVLGCPPVRRKPVRAFVDEILATLRAYPFVRTLHFQDDNLALDRGWLARFAAAYGSRVGLPFICNVHPRLLTQETCELLADMGCRSVQIGVESGSRRVREGVLARGVSEPLLREATLRLRRCGLKVATFNMVGLPTETLDDALQTVRLNAELRPTRTYCSIFVPFPGTALHERCVAEGSFVGGEEPASYPGYSEDPLVDCGEFGADQIRFVQLTFPALVRVWSAATETLLRTLLRSRAFPAGLVVRTLRRLGPHAIRAYLNIGVRIWPRFGRPARRPLGVQP